MKEKENIFEDEDIILPDDFEGIPTSEEEGEGEEVDTEQTSDVETETQNDANSDSKEQEILDFINAKGIKYNGEEVKVDNLDNLISTYQKGLNYDKLKDNVEAKNNDMLNFVESKAKSLNITPQEYIAKVQEYEKAQKDALVENEVQKMVERGIDEETARRVANMETYMESLKAKEQELNAREQAKKDEEAKEKEYEDFLKANPDIEIDKIPNEVFEKAKEVGLQSAYAQYENKLLKEKLKLIEQNQKNASNSVVSQTSDGSDTNQSGDAFLMGFDSV